jgi:hypothetical protein
MVPFPLWRESVINDADVETAQIAYSKLNSHPMQTVRDKISLSADPAQR